jgi:hypothetical protein
MPELSINSLPNQISSSAQIYQIINFINDSMNNIGVGFAGKGEEKKIRKQFEIPPSLQYFFSKDVRLNDLSALKKQLEQIAKTSSVVIITLSDIPSSDFKLKLTAWFRKLNPFVIVEFLIDDSIIGGLVIKTERRELDFSLRSTLLSQDIKIMDEIKDV